MQQNQVNIIPILLTQPNNRRNKSQIMTKIAKGPKSSGKKGLVLWVLKIQEKKLETHDQKQTNLLKKNWKKFKPPSKQKEWSESKLMILISMNTESWEKDFIPCCVEL